MFLEHLWHSVLLVVARNNKTKATKILPRYLIFILAFTDLSKKERNIQPHEFFSVSVKLKLRCVLFLIVLEVRVKEPAQEAYHTTSERNKKYLV